MYVALDVGQSLGAFSMESAKCSRRSGIAILDVLMRGRKAEVSARLGYGHPFHSEQWIHLG